MIFTKTQSPVSESGGRCRFILAGTFKGLGDSVQFQTTIVHICRVWWSKVIPILFMSVLPSSSDSFVCRGNHWYYYFYYYYYLYPHSGVDPSNARARFLTVCWNSTASPSCTLHHRTLAFKIPSKTNRQCSPLTDTVRHWADSGVAVKNRIGRVFKQ